MNQAVGAVDVPPRPQMKTAEEEQHEEEEEEKIRGTTTTSRQGWYLWLPLLLIAMAAATTAGLMVVTRQWHRPASKTMQHGGIPGGCHSPFVIPVWPDKNEDGRQDVTLTAYVPAANASSGTSVVIAPGGSYYGVAVEQEGTPYAKWLCAQGIASYVLEYRTAGKGFHAPFPELDARRALRTVRSRLRPFVDDYHKVGMIGSSAGGHLTATVLAYHDDGEAEATDPIERESSRPDFGVLVYPVVTMEDGVAHAFSKSNLLGPSLTVAQTENMTQHYSIEKHVGHDFPPTFLYSTEDDEVVPVENAYRLNQAFKAAKVVHETVIYAYGMHGSGLGMNSMVTEEGVLLNGHLWTGRCLGFLVRQGMLPTDWEGISSSKSSRDHDGGL